jgi:hypothetical protein
LVLEFRRREVRNIGTFDRVIRLVVGVMVLGLFGALDPPWKYFTLLGLIPVGTALTGNCPMYTWLGINTRGGGAPGAPGATRS